MTRIKAYIATRLFPLKIQISKKEYDTGKKESMPDDEFKQKFESVDSGNAGEDYFQVIANAPKEDDIDTLLLYKLFEQQNRLDFPPYVDAEEKIIIQ